MTVTPIRKKLLYTAPEDRLAELREQVTARGGARGVPARVLAGPLTLVTGLAAVGQAAGAYQFLAGRHLWWSVTVLLAVAFSVAMESVSLVLAAIAHAARVEGDAALPAQLGAYAVAAGTASINYDHWSGPGWAPNMWAICLAAFSLGSPMLWSTWSKAKYRRVLRRRGLVDKRAVRFSAARWLLYPVSTFGALRLAVKLDIQVPAEAVARYEAARAARRQARTVRDAAQDPPVTAGPPPVPARRPTAVAAPPAVPAAIEPPPPAPAPRAGGETAEQLAARLAAGGAGYPAIRRALQEAHLSMGDKPLRGLIRSHKPAPAQEAP